MSSLTEIQSTLNNISSSTESAYAAKSVKGSSEMGQDAFLRLMIEQMKNQDPMSPTDNSQMIAQTAQFTQITELQKLNSTLTNMNSSNYMNQSVGLIGKYVMMTDPNDTTKTISGKVIGMKTDGTNAYLVLDSKPDMGYSPALIQSVSDQPLVTDTTSTTGSTASTTTTGSTTTSGTDETQGS